MMWLNRLKKVANDTGTEPTKPTEALLSGFVAPFPGTIGEIHDPDRWSWPHSTAMNSSEIECMQRRIEIFARRGVRHDEAEALADSLVARDREGDDRRLCLECARLRQGFKCGAPVAGAGRDVAALLRLPQRCPAFEVAS